MRQHIVILLYSFSLVLLVCVLLRGDEAASSSPSAPIPLREVRERGVAGRLGPRLGTIVEVTGTVVENESNAKADVSEPFFLRIEQVNGKPLQTPQLFSSSAMQLIRNIPSLQVGDQFTCVGYERGEFRGSPDGEFEYAQPYATQGFFFWIEFVVLKADEQAP
jgi:hypothetical protein